MALPNVGDVDVLAPRPMPPTPERLQNNALVRVGLKDSAGNPSAEYQESVELFNSVATPSPADGSPTIDTVCFQAFMSQYAPQWSARAAATAFLAADVDGSKRLNRHEFALLRKALVTFEPTRDGFFEDLLELRCRALFATYASGENALNAAARAAVVRDLSGRASHVTRVLATLGWPMDDSVAPMQYAAFREAVRDGSLQKGALDLSDDPVSEMGVPPLKIDPRHVVMHQAALQRAPLAAPQPAVPVAATALAGPAAVAPDMKLDDELRIDAAADWRGVLAAPRESERFRIAKQIVDAGFELTAEMRTQPDVDHREWMADGAALTRLLGTDQPAEIVRRIGRLCEDVMRVARAQPMVVHVPAPCKCFGDVHGQLRDLMMLFCRYGYPSHKGGDIETTTYVFNGDWIDRGAHQLEVVVLLFALKTLYPARIFLVRGNHEFRSQSMAMGIHGFAHHVQHHPAFASVADQWHVVYEGLHTAFEWLPLAARVGKVVLVLHGGIGDGSWSISDLASVPRPLKNEYAEGVPHCALQALWSDPSDSDARMAQGVHYRQVAGLNMGHLPTADAPDHGVGRVVGFGPDVTLRFCEREGVRLVIRSHQFVPEGAKFMHGGHLVTLFSARNYSGGQTNDSALLLLAHDEQGALRVHTKRLAHRVPTRATPATGVVAMQTAP